MSPIELIIVQLICDPLGIGNAIPSQLVLSVLHGKWGKHKRRRIYRNLLGILTHQLAVYPLRQVECSQANSLEGLVDPVCDKSILL